MFGRKKKRGLEVDLKFLREDLAREERHHKSTRDEYKRMQDLVRTRDETLRLLLKLEPGLEKYRTKPGDAEMAHLLGFSAASQWDIEGMKAAEDFDLNRALASKYIDTDRAVSPEKRTIKKAGTQ